MKIFILEDNPHRIYALEQAIPSGNTITVAHRVSVAKASWDTTYDLLLLDHDLGNELPGTILSPSLTTGLGFARYIAHMVDPNTLAVLTSHNSLGAQAMYEELKDKCNLLREPFGERLLRALRKI